jgi:hypothetical protein
MNEQDKVINGFYNLAIMQAIHNLGNDYLYDVKAQEDYKMFVNNLEQYGDRGEA